MKTIAVFGATGMLGKPVTQELVAAGYAITALVRAPSEAVRAFPSGVKFVKGGLENIEAIRATLEGAEGVYISVSNKNMGSKFNAEKQGVENILTVARELNVRQVVFLSSFLARDYEGDWWVYRDKKSGIDAVKNSGVPYTIFYAANFMENFFRGMVIGNKVRIMKHPVENKSWWIAAADYARLVSAAFASDDALSREYPAQGPEAFTMREVAEQFATHYTKKKLSVSATPFKLIKFLGKIVPSIGAVAKTAEINIYNDEVFEAQRTWDELGKPAITVADFARQA